MNIILIFLRICLFSFDNTIFETKKIHLKGAKYMKYYKASKFTRAITSTGFITTIACLLIAFGAIAWFVLSRNNSVNEMPSTSNSQQSYPDADNSYNSKSDTPGNIPETSSTDVNDNVSNVPYTEDEIPVTPEPQPQTFILPIIGNISKGYSDTALQYSATYGDMRLHTGIDILCNKGSNIKSVGSGKVISVIDDAKLGKVVTVEYEENITVKYCGMGSVNVKENSNVATGDVIGTSGDIPSECADKPHIHIEVMIDGKNVSPFDALKLQ